MKKFILVILVLCFDLVISKSALAVSLTNTISISVYPALLAIDEKTNKIYAVSFPDAMSIQVIDGSTDTPLTTIPIDAGENAGLSGIAVNSNTGTVYVLKSTSFESREDKIFIIDGSSNMVTDEIITEPYGLSGNIALDQTANRIYVTSNNSVTGFLNSVTVIDATSKTILSSLELTGSPGKMVVDSSKNRIYAINTIANEIFVLEFDTNSNKLSLIATIAIEDGGGPESIALNPSTNRLYTNSLNADSIYVIDTNTNQVIEKILGRKKNDEFKSLGLNPKTNKLYAAFNGNSFLKTSDEIIVYDASTFAIDDSIKSAVDDGINLEFDSVEFFANQTTNKIYAAASINSTTPIYVLSDGSGTSGGSSTSSGGSSTSEGSSSSSSGQPLIITNFKNTLKEFLNANKDFRRLKENTDSKKIDKFIDRTSKSFEKSINKIKTAINKLPSIACQVQLAKLLGDLESTINKLDLVLCPPSDDPEEAESPDCLSDFFPVRNKLQDVVSELKEFSMVDNDGNSSVDVCE